MGASTELRPMSLGLGSSLWIGGRIDALLTLLAVTGRGESFLVGLRPDRVRLLFWDPGGGGVWEGKDGTPRSWGRTIGRCCPYGVDGRDPLGIFDGGNPAKGPTSRFP